MGEIVSIDDVLLNYFDGAPSPADAASRSLPELQDLAEALAAFYRSWRPLSPQEDEIRLFIGNNDLAHDREALLSLLLYANSVVVPDPVQVWLARDWSGWRQGLVHESDVRTELGRALRKVGELAPGLRSGAVIAAPLPFDPWGIDESILRAGADAAMRPEFASAAVGPGWLARSDYQPDEAGDIWDYDANAAAFGQMRAERCAQALRSRARFAPLDDLDWAYVRDPAVVGAPESKTATFELLVTKAVAAVDVPFFRDLDLETLVKIRTDEEAFAEWQAELRQAVRHLETLDSSEEFLDHADLALRDTLVPKAAAVRRATQRSRVLSASLREEVGALGLAGIAVGGLASAGVSLPYSVGAASITAVARITLKSLFTPTPTGSRAVLLGLMKRR
jgi:hypothetical protein